jgi:hypothetical protein
MNVDDPMTVSDRYARAATTSDLTVGRWQKVTDMNTLLAAAIAAGKDRDRQLALSLQRIAVTGDRSGLRLIMDDIDSWLAQHKGRLIPRMARRALAMTVLVWWFEPACRYCNGNKFVAIENTGRLSDEACISCHGSGRRPLAREVPAAHARQAEWLAAKLDRLMSDIETDMARLLNDGADRK